MLARWWPPPTDFLEGKCRRYPARHRLLRLCNNFDQREKVLLDIVALKEIRILGATAVNFVAVLAHILIG